MTVSTKKICVMAMGIALYVVLSLCLQVPVFENYYLCLGYVVMAVYCYSFGPWSGMIVGFLGVVLYCLAINGLRGMPGWAIGNLVIGAVLGVVFQKVKQWKKGILGWIVYVVAVLISVAVGILVIKSGVEHLLYAQPFLFRAAKNIYAFAADVFMLLVSLPLCVRLDGYLHAHCADLISKRG